MTAVAGFFSPVCREGQRLSGEALGDVPVISLKDLRQTALQRDVRPGLRTEMEGARAAFINQQKADHRQAHPQRAISDLIAVVQSAQRFQSFEDGSAAEALWRHHRRYDAFHVDLPHSEAFHDLTDAVHDGLHGCVPGTHAVGARGIVEQLDRYVADAPREHVGEGGAEHRGISEGVLQQAICRIIRIEAEDFADDVTAFRDGLLRRTEVLVRAEPKQAVGRELQLAVGKQHAVLKAFEKFGIRAGQCVAHVHALSVGANAK